MQSSRWMVEPAVVERPRRQPCLPECAGTFAVACVLALLTLAGFAPALAATPPALVNYQGVLRDNNDKPLSGAYDMLFRFMDAATAGNEIMKDQHAAATSNAITVSGGLFDTPLGSGTITGGTGLGTYTSLDAVFRDYGAVWLEVRVGAETLSPRTRVSSAAYALDASFLSGRSSSDFIDTSTTGQTKNGQLSVVDSNASETALVGDAQAVGGNGVYGHGDNAGVYGVGNSYGGSFSGGSTASIAVYGFEA